ncbi:FtsX-like permease family protein, partial [Bordetella pertussis]|uniref:FtsX-like permease family protein n=1 Tax=Bordetella pertussis TaxID=520 RepID=UPI003879E1BC
IAVMRCLGAVQAQVTRMLVLEFALVGLAASAVGCLLGYAVLSRCRRWRSCATCRRPGCCGATPIACARVA